MVSQTKACVRNSWMCDDLNIAKSTVIWRDVEPTMDSGISIVLSVVVIVCRSWFIASLVSESGPANGAISLISTHANEILQNFRECRNYISDTFVQFVRRIDIFAVWQHSPGGAS